jgi:hypothetical protein
METASIFTVTEHARTLDTCLTVIVAANTIGA